MGCGCKQDKAMVERKIRAKQERKKQHELRKAQSSQQNADPEDAEAKRAAFDEYIRTRQPIGYQDTAGGRKALYADFVFPAFNGQHLDWPVATLTKQPSRRGRDNRLLSKRQNRHRSRAEHRRNNDGVT